jgi:glycosyltransferase involved in cell wall biosynthesis
MSLDTNINDRINNLRHVLDWINGFQGVDVILVEQDKHSKISHLNLKCRHIFLKTKQPYNRSWAFNVAMKNAKSGIIVFGDSDIIMDPTQFIESLRSLENFMVSPYKSVLDLRPEESHLPLTELYKINRPGRGENDNQKINPCGGIVMYRADAINKIEVGVKIL